jgi:hypothetical protein
MIITMSVSLGITTNMKAVQTVAVKAERQALVNTLVGDNRDGVVWGTPASPDTQLTTLENGVVVDVTTVRNVTNVGTYLYAATSIVSGPDAADCTDPTTIADTNCVYANRFHVSGLEKIEPLSILRKYPYSTAAEVIGAPSWPAGSAHSQVFGQNNLIASASSSGVSTVGGQNVWRFLIMATSHEDTAEIRIDNAGEIVAVIPIDPTSSNYFGTFVSEADDLHITVSQGNVVVDTVYVYYAGGK